MQLILSLVDLLDWDSDKTQIFLISRVPRLIAIILAGAGMSIAGLIMQSLSRNKFVSPTTAGTLDAAKLGIIDFNVVLYECNVYTANYF